MIARLDHKVIHRILACILISSASLMLSACGKTIEFTEEVQLFGSDKKVTLERREIFEPRMVRLDLKQTYIRSELSIAGSNLPLWKARLHPIYFDELREGGGYFLVATIHDSIGCYERGRPNSPYVVFVAKEREWHEIPIPRYIDGRSPNLLLRFDGTELGKKILAKERTEQLNNWVGLSPIKKTIQLSAKFGC